jgi:hypothetical protein
MEVEVVRGEEFGEEEEEEEEDKGDDCGVETVRD